MFIFHKNNSNKYISIPIEGLFSHGLSVMYNARQSLLRGHQDDLTSVSQEENKQVLALLMVHSKQHLRFRNNRYMPYEAEVKMHSPCCTGYLYFSNSKISFLVVSLRTLYL